MYYLGACFLMYLLFERSILSVRFIQYMLYFLFYAIMLSYGFSVKVLLARSVIRTTLILSWQTYFSPYSKENPGFK